MTLRWIVAALLWAAFAAGAQAQQLTKIRLSLDWLFEGQTSFLHMARYKGYFEKEGLEVQVDVGTGSSGAFQRIISGAYDAGLGDMSSQIEYLARNTGPLQFESVYVQYDQIPAAFFALKKSGIKSVKDFAGRPFLESPTGFSRRIWPLLAKAAGIDPNSVRWVTASPALRATMLVKDEVDIISGFLSIPLELKARGVKAEDIVTIPVSDYGIHFYGNTLVVSTKLIEGNPKAVARAGPGLQPGVPRGARRPGDVGEISQAARAADPGGHRARAVPHGDAGHAHAERAPARTRCGGHQAAGAADPTGVGGLRSHQPAAAGAALQSQVPAAASPAHAALNTPPSART